MSVNQFLRLCKIRSGFIIYASLIFFVAGCAVRPNAYTLVKNPSFDDNHFKNSKATIGFTGNVLLENYKKSFKRLFPKNTFSKKICQIIQENFINNHLIVDGEIYSGKLPEFFSGTSTLNSNDIKNAKLFLNKQKNPYFILIKSVKIQKFYYRDYHSDDPFVFHHGHAYFGGRNHFGIGVTLVIRKNVMLSIDLEIWDVSKQKSVWSLIAKGRSSGIKKALLKTVKDLSRYISLSQKEQKDVK